MLVNYRVALFLAVAGLLLESVGCTTSARSGGSLSRQDSAVLELIETVKAEYGAGGSVFKLGVARGERQVTVTGLVERAEAKLALAEAAKRKDLRIVDRIEIVPEVSLGEQLYGISTVSTAAAREAPQHKAELGTQILMGHSIRLLKRSGRWYYAQAADGYLAWVREDTFIPCNAETLAGWTQSLLLIVTAMEDQILSQPVENAEPVSDVVMANLVRKRGETGDWIEVELPDGRRGYLPRRSATDYRAWQALRKPTPENIEATARQFLGRPYLWGGNSPKALDCSGFTKLVFFLNGVDLQRNASQQATQGREVALSATFSELKTGDLVFFGVRGRAGRLDRVTHVGIYLRDGHFIHASGRIHISDLHDDSTVTEEGRHILLLSARRILKDY